MSSSHYNTPSIRGTPYVPSGYQARAPYPAASSTQLPPRISPGQIYYSTASSSQAIHRYTTSSSVNSPPGGVAFSKNQLENHQIQPVALSALQNRASSSSDNTPPSGILVTFKMDKSQSEILALRNRVENLEKIVESLSKKVEDLTKEN